MNKAQPATIFNEMIGKLDHFYLNDSHSLPPDSLVYRRMVRDCELLKQADPCEGWIAHGLSELLIGNKKGFQSCFRSEEHTSELQSLMRISYAVFCLKKKKTHEAIQN